MSSSAPASPRPSGQKGIEGKRTMSGIPGRQISDQQSEVNSRSLCVGSHAAGGYFLHSFLRRRFCSLLSCAGSRVLLASGHQKASARFCVWCAWRKRLRFRLCPPAPSFLTYICFCALLPLLPQVQERGGMSYSESDSDDDNSLASAPRSSNAGSPPGGAGTGPKLRRRLSRNGLVSLEHTTVVVFSLGRKQQAMVFSSYSLGCSLSSFSLPTGAVLNNQGVTDGTSPH